MSIKDRDPLEGLGDAHIFYKLDEVVFAEPLKIFNMENPDADDGTLTDNILVERKVGQRNKKYHIVIENPNDPVCPQKECKKRFSSITLLKGHIRKVHCAEKTFICEWCGAGFPAKYLLERHTMVHKLLKISCPVCKKLLSARTKMSNHLNTHTNARTHTCEVCAKAFTRKSVLDRHKMKLHRRET